MYNETIIEPKRVHSIKGANYPVATLNERVLCVCACKWVDEVIIGAPLEITDDMCNTMNINYVAVGTHTTDPETHFREPGFTKDTVVYLIVT